MAARAGNPSPHRAEAARAGLEQVACAVCGGASSRPYRTGMYRLGDERFDLVRCACGMVYVDPRPDGARLAAMYEAEDYYSAGYNLGVETEDYFSRRAELLGLYDAAVARYERETGLARARLFELGSAGGFLLEAARRRGWSVRGVELSPRAARYSIAELGLDVFQGQLAEAPFAPASFDLALADNVLEHTTDPAGVLRQLGTLLAPRGWLIVIVPSYVNSPYFRLLQLAGRAIPRGLLGRETLKLLKFDGADAGPPYHILEFDRRALAALVRRAGFAVRRVERSLPLPAHLFKNPSPTLAVRAQRLAFRALDGAMRAGLAPGARLRFVLQKPD